MNRNLITPVLLAAVLLAALAALPGPDALAQDHGHDHGAEEDAHDHAAEQSTVAVTLWTDTMELFMEYPGMVAMESGSFIIHLTVLDGFQPVRGGRVTLQFTGPDGATEVRTADTLLREGIFAPMVGLRDAGAYDFTLTYEGPEARSTFRIPGFRVHPSAAAAAGHPADEEAAEIAFLKEQQWKVPFATAEAAEREMKRSIRAIAQVLPSPATHVEITAPSDGVLQVSGAGDLALPGARVRRGDVVARIAPPLQGQSWTASRLNLVQAERNYERARRLRDRDAISRREFEEAENAYLTARDGHENLSGEGRDGVLTLTAPIAGQVIGWDVRPGQRLTAGQRLMTIADPQRVWLQVNVYQSDFRSLGTPVGVWLDKGDGGRQVPADRMQVLTVGGALDPVTRTVPVLLEIDNRDGLLTINESTPVELQTGQGALATAVPQSALYEDEGVSVVFVQTGGEAFAKRVVRVGPRHAGWVSILAGLEPGERVVTLGGYHVKLASTTAEIGHGHAH